VLPLDDRVIERLNPDFAGRPDIMAGRSHVELWRGMPGLKEDVAPNLKNISFRIRALVSSGSSRDEGVLMAQGGRFGGWSLYVKKGSLSMCYNYLDLGREYVVAKLPALEGRFELGADFQYDGGGLGKGGEVTLYADGVAIGSGRLSRTVPIKFSYDETLDVGCDRGTPVTDEYAEGVEQNAYSGALQHVTIDLVGPRVLPGAAAEIRAALGVH
jgi:arylsulfatase